MALAAATALAADTGGRRTLTLSGQEALTVAQVAQQIAEVLGQDIAVVDVTVDQLRQGMEQAGLPPPVAATFASFDDNQARGGFAHIKGDFEALTQRPPTSFAAWLKANKDALAALQSA